MNRREFTASMAALAAAPTLPFPLNAAATPQSAAVPAGTYAWAQLIARAQNRCSPAMLARQLRLSDNVAQQLFNKMLRDGVLNTPGAAGVAQAAQPINATGSPTHTTFKKLRALITTEEYRDEASPLVNDDTTSLGCPNINAEELTDAGETKSIQESPQKR